MITLSGSTFKHQHVLGAKQKAGGWVPAFFGGGELMKIVSFIAYA